MTDDPETPALHGWEINVPFTLTDTSGSRALQVPLFDVNYGYRENVQIKVEFPILNVNSRTAGHATGIGDTLIGIKWRLLEEDKKRPHLAFYPQVGLPTGDSDRGLGAGDPFYLLPVLVQKSWGRWTGFSNIAYVLQTAGGSRDYAYYGVAFSYEVRDHLDLGAEIFGNTPPAKDATSDRGFNLGAEWSLRKGRVLLFSAGHGLSGAGAMLYAGLQMQFGPGHKHHRKIP